MEIKEGYHQPITEPITLRNFWTVLRKTITAEFLTLTNEGTLNTIKTKIPR
jgi:hypothetical protein